MINLTLLDSGWGQYFPLQLGTDRLTWPSLLGCHLGLAALPVVGLASTQTAKAIPHPPRNHFAGPIVRPHPCSAPTKNHFQKI